jgi:hypothetical protein
MENLWQGDGQNIDPGAILLDFTGVKTGEDTHSSKNSPYIQIVEVIQRPHQRRFGYFFDFLTHFLDFLLLVWPGGYCFTCSE